MIITMLPYPKELRARVVAAAERGEYTLSEISDLFGVSLSFTKKMISRQRAGEDLEPRHGGGPKPLLKEKEQALLRAEIKNRPDATLAELQQALVEDCQVEASLPTISRALQQLNLPRKKKSHRQ
jgi:transposase